MKRRLLATVCSAAILANMVPYQAFADNAQATPETAQSITLDSAAQAFAADGQTEAYNYKLKVAVSGVNGGYVKAGDKVKVAVTISDAAWATDANKAGFIAASIELTYDSEVLEPNYDEELGPKFKNLRNPNPNKSDTVSYTISGNIDENAGRLNWVVEAPNPAKIGKDQWRATYADLSENDTVIVTYSFTAKTDIPKGLSKSLGFNLTSKGKDNADSAFGDFVSQSNKLFVKATAEIENNTSLKVDTKAPTITLSDTANNGKFFYAPVGVTVADDGIGLASVTFGGKELTLSADGSYSLTESGTLTATDKLGNTSKLDITIDTTALDAARAAVAKLPDAAPDYTCKANLEAAEKAVENLKATDSAAYSKLTEAELNKIAAARTVVDAIDDEIQTAQADIAALPSDIQPTAITIEAVSKVRDQLKALTNKGVDVEKDVANYSIYKAAEEKLNAALEEIGGIKNDIKDFKYTGYGDKSAVSALRGKVTALQTKYGDDILSDADLKNLTDAEAAVKATGDKVDAVVTEIGKLPTSLKPLAAADSAVQAVKTSVEALVKEGVVPDTDISNYSDLVTLSEKVDAAKGEVNALKADIAGFTYTDYSDKTEVGNLNDRLNDLKAAYGDDILTDAELKNLTDAKNAVEQTNNEINAAVALINAKTATPLNPLSEAESALKDLRTAMDALADKGVDIENEISNYKKFADFEKTVNDASDAVKAAADEVAAFKYTGYGDKDAVAALRKKVDDLNKQYGDVLTGNAIKNLTDAETAVESTEKKIDAAIALIDTLPDKVEVTDANIKLISNIDSALDELTDLGVDNAKYGNNLTDNNTALVLDGYQRYVYINGNTFLNNKTGVLVAETCNLDGSYSSMYGVKVNGGTTNHNLFYLNAGQIAVSNQPNGDTAANFTYNYFATPKDGKFVDAVPKNDMFEGSVLYVPFYETPEMDTVNTDKSLDDIAKENQEDTTKAKLELAAAQGSSTPGGIDSSLTLSGNKFEELQKESNKAKSMEVTVKSTSNETDVIWDFEKDKLKDDYDGSSVNLGVAFTFTDFEQDIVSNVVTKSKEDGTTLNSIAYQAMCFSHSGDLPGEATVKIRMNESLLDYYSKHNNSLEGFKIYYVNEGTGKLEVMRDASGNPKTLSVEVVDGVYFAVTSIDHCSSYLLTPEDLNEAISGLTKILLNAGAPLTLDELTQPDGAVLRLLSHMEPGVTLNKLAQYLSGGSMTVLDTNGNKVGADAPLGTGYTIGLGADGKTGGVTVAVAGDLNGDGSVDTKDLTMMRQAILQIGQLTQVQLKAATPSTNGSRVDTNDLVLLRRYLLSMTKTMLD